MSPAPLLVTISDGAAMLGFSRRTIYRLIETGKITPVYPCKRPMLRVSQLKAIAGEPVGEPATGRKLFPDDNSSA